MSLNFPATEKETDEAMDHPPGIHPMFATSPITVPTGNRILVIRIKPQEMGATNDNPRNYRPG
jgi:hypothetical protein